MKRCHQLSLLLVVMASASAIPTADALAQLNLPTIIQLPTDPFVWNWGRTMRGDDRQRPEFTIQGIQQQFHCTLTGAFRLGSRMRDFYNQREFEQSLSSTLYFIEDATAALNYYYRQVELQWATLDCTIPEGEPTDEKTEERVDRALERAERARERRRSREEDDD